MAFILFCIGVMGGLLAVVVLRADPRRWDNRFFAVTMCLDALLSVVRSICLLSGLHLFDRPCLQVSLVLNVLLAYASAEFVWAFPSGRPAPHALRIPVLGWTLVCAGLASHPDGFRWFGPRGDVLFFWPFFAVVLGLLAKNARALRNASERGGVAVVLIGVALRWTFSVFAYDLAKGVSHPAFRVILALDASVVVFLGYVLFGWGVLRYNLFRVRGVVAEILLYTGMGVTSVGAVTAGIGWALSLPVGATQRLALLGFAALPVALYALLRWARPRIERALLVPIDPRRGIAKHMLARVARGAETEVRPAALVRLAVDALRELAGGGAGFVPGPAYRDEGGAPPALQLPPRLVTYLADNEVALVRGTDLAAEVADAFRHVHADRMVAVRRGGAFYGALTLERGCCMDRDTVTGAVTLAEHLALKLENCALFTEMLALRGELEESRRLASLGAFAAAIAHDIRTPLTSVQMNVQILRGKVSLPEDDMEYFDIALDELRRLNGSVQEILDYAKPVEMRPAEVELSGLADEAARRMAPLLEERHVGLDTRLGAGLPPVLADAQHLRQVLINLIDNAAQASEEGARIELVTRRSDDGKVAFEVADRGRGICAADLPKIFEPFFTTRADGTGLGLAIAQKLVRANGGEIRVASAVGSGSTFTVLLPAA
ncbi:MAG: ATP-binding protein [Polyangiaceae bacterium]